MRLDVPAGALDADLELTISTGGVQAPAAYALHTPVFTFAPAGTRFSAPATVTFELPAGATAPAVFWSRADGGWALLGGEVAGDTIAAGVTHFSSGFSANGNLSCPSGQFPACMPSTQQPPASLPMLFPQCYPLGTYAACAAVNPPPPELPRCDWICAQQSSAGDGGLPTWPPGDAGPAPDVGPDVLPPDLGPPPPCPPGLLPACNPASTLSPAQQTLLAPFCATATDPASCNANNSAGVLRCQWNCEPPICPDGSPFSCVVSPLRSPNEIPVLAPICATYTTLAACQAQIPPPPDIPRCDWGCPPTPPPDPDGGTSSPDGGGPPCTPACFENRLPTTTGLCGPQTAEDDCEDFFPNCAWGCAGAPGGCCAVGAQAPATCAPLAQASCDGVAVADCVWSSTGNCP